MKDIIKLFSTIILLMTMFVHCNNTEIIGKQVYEGEPFVRFFLVLDNNNKPIYQEEIDNSNQAVSEYEKTTIEELKIPVALSSAPFEGEVTVDFSVTVSGNFDGYSIEPKNTLTFNKNKYIDTIYVSFSKRWETGTTIEFHLTNVSDKNINIGNLNEHTKNDKLNVMLSEVKTSYTLSNNRIEIEGNAGEQITFDVLFPDGFFPDEIAIEDMFVVDEGFDISIDNEPYTLGDSKITYTITLNEDVNNEYYQYQSVIQLKEGGLYTPKGTSLLQIVKPIKTVRDKSVNPAANFYNLNDPYYRTYGETWMDFNQDGECEWSSFNMFTYPVVVDASHPDAVLYDDKGTPDTEDDIYHHAFKIGFNSPNEGRTTNSFNLKRWFSNESTDEENSPGFNITDAIEFFPDNGNSQTEGMIKIVEQYLTIAGKSGNSYTISISGEGRYKEISDGIFELDFELRAESNELFGGVRVAKYKIYNTKTYTEPDMITSDCFDVMEL